MVQSWNNNDGLYLKFGPDKSTAKNAGEYRTNGQLREVEVKINLTSLGSSASIIDDTVFIPAGVRLQEVVVIGETAATSGGSATLDIGLQRTDRSTELDYNGIIAAMAKTAVDAAGEQNTVTPGGTSAGALLGTTTANKGYITANYNTAAFTAGVVKVKLRFYKP